MYCPACGAADQSVESFCRQCGVKLPDFNKIAANALTPEKHQNLNLVMNIMTMVTTVGLALALYVTFLPRVDTPFIIYLTAGLMVAISAWQLQVLWRNLILRKHFKSRRDANETTEKKHLAGVDTRKLSAGDENDIVSEESRRPAETAKIKVERR